MRRKADPHFGKICQFFDTKKRRCTIYTARPTICREYPGGGCGYYSFLMARAQFAGRPQPRRLDLERVTPARFARR